MGYRVRGRGHFTAPVTRSGHSFVHAGRRVTVAGDNFQLQWNGPALVDLITEALIGALDTLSDDALRYMQSIVPVDTGATRDSCFAVVEVQNDRVYLVIGAGTDYAIYIELGTSSHMARPFIRPTFDYVVQRLPGIIRAEVANRGLR